MRADLHVHSSASDGSDPPAEVMRRAARVGLDVVALTDHDTVAGHAEAHAAAGPVTLLPGMELSCRLDGRSLHMLAYLFDADQPELAAELTRIRDDRVLRARATADKLARLIAVAHDLALVTTGGSDDHGSLTDYRLGGETTGGQAYQDLLARVPANPA